MSYCIVDTYCIVDNKTIDHVLPSVTESSRVILVFRITVSFRSVVLFVCIIGSDFYAARKYIIANRKIICETISDNISIPGIIRSKLKQTLYGVLKI